MIFRWDIRRTHFPVLKLLLQLQWVEHKFEAESTDRLLYDVIFHFALVHLSCSVGTNSLVRLAVAGGDGRFVSLSADFIEDVVSPRSRAN